MLLEIAIENFVLEDLVPRRSLLLLHSKHSLEEILSHRRKPLVDLQGLGLDVFDQFIGRFGNPGCFAVQQLVEDDSHCPDVALGGVRLALEHFHRHVQRRAN